MIATQTALTVPPKAVLAVIMNACFFLASCGGGGGGMGGTITPPPSTTTSLSPAALRPIILFDGFEHFETAQNQAIAIDVATGQVTPLPVESARFQLQGRYFCSHCQQNFGTAPGALIFDASAQSAQFELANDEIALNIQLTIQDNELQATLEQPPLFHKQGLNQTITDYHALGTFFGPEAQQTGLLFSLIQEQGILTGAAIGHRP